MRRTYYTTWLLLLALLSWSFPTWGEDLSLQVGQQAVLLGTESPALQTLLERSRGSQAQQAFTLQVLQEAHAMKERGLPVEPYLLKANEGLAKGIPPQRIAPALRSTLQQTERADQLLERTLPRGSWTSPEMRQRAVLNVQKALLNQVPSQQIERTLRTHDWNQGTRELTKRYGKEGSRWNQAKTALSQEMIGNGSPERPAKIPVDQAPKPEKNTVKGTPTLKVQKGPPTVKKGPKKDPGWSFEKTKGVPKQKNPSSPSGKGQGKGK